MSKAIPPLAIKKNWLQKLAALCRQHLLVARETTRHLLITPWSSLMTWLVIGIALALPAGMLLLLDNLQSVSQDWDNNAQISLFIKKDQTIKQIEILRNEISAKGGVANVQSITPDEALKEFQQLSGFGDVLNKLEKNPLPHVLIVELTDQLAQTISKDSNSAINILFEELRQLPAVDQAVLDQAWLQRLHAILQFGHRATFLLALLLSLGVVLVIGNTIRLAIENRRDEILVIKLVGGTDTFVRRPFLYTGIWFGFGGAVVGALLVSATIFWLSGPIDNLAALYQSTFKMQNLGFSGSLILALSGSALGFIGAWLAVWRELNRIEPN